MMNDAGRNEIFFDKVRLHMIKMKIEKKLMTIVPGEV